MLGTALVEGSVTRRRARRRTEASCRCCPTTRRLRASKLAAGK
jgi:hypothetical protein